MSPEEIDDVLESDRYYAERLSDSAARVFRLLGPGHMAGILLEEARDKVLAACGKLEFARRRAASRTSAPVELRGLTNSKSGVR